MRIGSAIAALTLLFLAISSCAGAKVRQYKAVVVAEHPHDETSYTQGLFFDGGRLCESTGQWGESTFRIVDIQTGKAQKRLDFDRKYFVEGSVAMDGKFYILTWTNKVAFVYDAKTLQYEATYSYPHEGWGLTTDGKQLISSDGTSRLYFMDGKFKVGRTVDVTLDGRKVNYLNELEYIDGKIWANVYLTDMIVVIEPSSGKVEATIDCTGLLPDNLRDARTDVLNGIATSDDGKLYLTGKYWKRLYEIRLEEK